MFDKEQVGEEVVLITEKEMKDHRYALEAVQEDPGFDEYPDWNLKTHSTVWDIQHGHVLIPCEKKERSRSRSSYR